MGLIDGFLSLGKSTNKTKNEDEEVKQGAGELVPELTLDMDDEEIIALTKNWKHKWDDSEVKAKWEKVYKDNEKYWKGEHYSALETEQHALMDNAVFEALETFLPQATRRNPEPQVDSSTPENPQAKAFADAIEKRLIAISDNLKLRLKIKKAARHWAIYTLGAAKIGWSQITNDITIKTLRPTKLVLDPDATIDEDGYTGDFIGEYKTQTASVLIGLFPEAKDIITEAVKEKLGTEVTYMEWHTPDYICWTFEDKVLSKSKNVNWNYDSEPQNQQTQVDEFGQETPSAMPAKNHFPAPRMPYVFLSIFNLGRQPVDDTSLITQTLPLQDLINKRLRQIDKNVDSQNGGLAVSGDYFTEDQAKQASDTIRKGGTIFVPTGNPDNAVTKLDNKPLGAEAFTQLADTRSRFADIFGVKGSTSAGIQKEDTVRGKIINRGLDTDRIGGGVTEYLEQFADDILNWCVQLMYVYYELDQQFPGGIPDTKLTVSVKEGSLLPKDNASMAQQAMELAQGGMMSLLDLYTKLEDPNPKERAVNAWLEKNAPQVLYGDDPRVQQVVMQMQAQAQAQAAQAAQQGQQEQQQAHQGEQVKHAHGLEAEQMKHQNKMQQQQAKQDGDLLNKVQLQKNAPQ